MYQSFITMASNKERTEVLEAELGGVREGMQQMERDVTDKLHWLKETINLAFRTYALQLRIR